MYLGVELNRDLNFEELGKYRVRAGLATLDVITKSLVNQSMPMMYKQMLIKGLLLPRMTYGIDIYGAVRENVNPIRKVLKKIRVYSILPIGLVK